MPSRTGIDKKRNIRAKNISPSLSIENAWKNTYVGNLLVNKPGFPNQIPREYTHGLSRVLKFLGFNLKNIMPHNRISIFDNYTRSNLFSYEL